MDWTFDSFEIIICILIKAIELLQMDSKLIEIHFSIQNFVGKQYAVSE